METTIEHVTITHLGKYVRLTPDEGYLLFNTLTETTFSDAVVLEKEIKMFVAVAVEETAEETLA